MSITFGPPFVLSFFFFCFFFFFFFFFIFLLFVVVVVVGAGGVAVAPVLALTIDRPTSLIIEDKAMGVVERDVDENGKKLA